MEKQRTPAYASWMPFVVAVFLFGASVRSQSAQIVPRAFASVEGGSFTSFPFGRSTAVLVQQGYGGEMFAARRATLRRIGFRADANRALGAKGIDVEIGLGSIAPSGLLQTTFARNRGTDFTNVLRRRRVSLPAIPSASGPRPFSIEFALDSPFVFDPTSNGLLVEIRVFAQQSGRYEIDLDASCTSARADFGASCRGSNGKLPVADCPTTALVPGRPFTLRVRDLRPTDLALGFLGSKESGVWQGLQLPARMDPFGAPGCWLNLDIVVAAGGVVNSLGELRLPGRVPNLNRVVGLWLRFQGIALDAKANALGLSFSNGHKIQVCGTPPMSRVLATRSNATAGTLELGVVPVTRFVE